MPHSGQCSGASRTTSGCIGQRSCIGAATATSFIPHCGQRSGSLATTSGCIGHDVHDGSPSGASMSISATNASVLSGARVEVRREPLALGRPLRVVRRASNSSASESRRPARRRPRSSPARRCRSGVRCSSVSRPGPVEEDVDDGPLGRGEHDLVDDLLALVAAAVPADELHPRAGQGNVEDTRVRRVRQVEADDLARARVERRGRSRRRRAGRCRTGPSPRMSSRSG